MLLKSYLTFFAFFGVPKLSDSSSFLFKNWSLNSLTESSVCRLVSSHCLLACLIFCFLDGKKNSCWPARRGKLQTSTPPTFVGSSSPFLFLPFEHFLSSAEVFSPTCSAGWLVVVYRNTSQLPEFLEKALSNCHEPEVEVIFIGFIRRLTEEPKKYTHRITAHFLITISTREIEDSYGNKLFKDFFAAYLLQK